MNRHMFLAAVLIVLLLPTVTSAPEHISYITVEGRISLQGSEPLIEPVLITKEEKVYSLSGLVEELKRLSGARVRVTGGLNKSRLPRTEGDIKVETYKLLDPGLKTDVSWAMGKIREAKKEVVLIGEDQVIYTLKELSVSQKEKLIGTKAVLIGTLCFHGRFKADIKVDSYKILRENQ